MAISGLIAGGVDQALEQVLERRLKEALRQQQEREHADQVAIQREQLANTRRTIDLNELIHTNQVTAGQQKRADDLGREQTAKNAGSDMAGVLAMPGMSNEAKANEIMGSGLRTGQIDPARVIEGLTRVPPKPERDPIADYRSRKEIDQQFERPAKPDKPGTHVVDGHLVDDTGKVLFTSPNKKPGGSDSRSQGYRADKSNSVIRKINDLLGDPADPQSKSRINSRTAGVVGSALAHVPWNTEARDVSAELQSLAADLAFEQLQKMRDASKTGGALGQVSNIELDLLKNAEASIRQDQSPANLTRQLDIIRDSATRFDAAVEKYGGGLEPMKPATSRDGGGAAPSGGKRLRFDRTGKPIP